MEITKVSRNFNDYGGNLVMLSGLDKSRHFYNLLINKF